MDADKRKDKTSRTKPKFLSNTKGATESGADASAMTKRKQSCEKHTTESEAATLPVTQRRTKYGKQAYDTKGDRPRGHGEASRCAMEAADEIKVEGTEMMPTAIPYPPETWGVETMRTGKGIPPRNVGTVARKAIGRANDGKNAPIRREPDRDPVPDIPTKEIGSDRTTPKDPEKPEKGLRS